VSIRRGITRHDSIIRAGRGKRGREGKKEKRVIRSRAISMNNLRSYTYLCVTRRGGGRGSRKERKKRGEQQPRGNFHPFLPKPWTAAEEGRGGERQRRGKKKKKKGGVHGNPAIVVPISCFVLRIRGRSFKKKKKKKRRREG